MATRGYLFAPVKSTSLELQLTNQRTFTDLRRLHFGVVLATPSSLDVGVRSRFDFGVRFRRLKSGGLRRKPTSRSTAAVMLTENPVFRDIWATAFSGGIALSFLRLWEETAKRGLFDQVANIVVDPQFLIIGSWHLDDGKVFVECLHEIRN
ncbi:unnamed protein product [Ilex paraguariensis]|uniref:Uncharacterized protein n=1 Tax=Ilex paraguariensis TaxID=185542 RepID=A0ABC8UT90_9AQUA